MSSCFGHTLYKPANSFNRYSIRVGRSLNPSGPFVDKSGKDLVDGGGEIVYGSNRDVYAPGGQGILADVESDILYYHYRELLRPEQAKIDTQISILTDPIRLVNTTVGYDFNTAKMGWNPLEYVDGWPVAVF